MRKPKAKVLGIVAALVFAFLIVGCLLMRTPEDEPRYNGHSLSFWVDSYGLQLSTAVPEDSPEFQAATNAISQIGTNAPPLLLKWIRFRYDSFPWVHRIEKIPRVLGRDSLMARVNRGTSRRACAFWCFRLLGTNAEPAIPKLTAMMRDTNAPAAWIRVEAIHALIDIGKPAFSLLTQTLPDTNQPGRSYIVDTIAVRMPEALGTNICVQLLATVLADPDYGVRVAATSGLAFLAPQAMTNNTLRPIPGTVEATNAPAK